MDWLCVLDGRMPLYALVTFLPVHINAVRISRRHSRSRPMQYGVVFPQTEFGNDIQAIKDYAQTAEALGYDYLLVYDHVLGAHPTREPKLTGPYTYEHPFHEPMVFFGFLAAITTRLELVTGILMCQHFSGHRLSLIFSACS